MSRQHLETIMDVDGSTCMLIALDFMVIRTRVHAATTTITTITTTTTTIMILPVLLRFRMIQPDGFSPVSPCTGAPVNAWP